MGDIGLRHQHHARGLPIQPVHNARSLHTTDSAQRTRAMRQQRMNQRVLPCTSPRMHHHACRLVDRDEVLVLVQNLKGNFNRPKFRRSGFGKPNGQCFSRKKNGISGKHLTASLDKSRVK